MSEDEFHCIEYDLPNYDRNDQDNRGVERCSPGDPTTFAAMHRSSQTCKQREVADRIDRSPNCHEIANDFFEHK
jgi:hypothetical protein